MNGQVPVVDLSSGLVSNCEADALSLDLPAALGMEVETASLDGLGLLHFAGIAGGQDLAQPQPSPLSARHLDEPFLVCTAPADRDANGWVVFRVCVREP